jgi:hypothetical protein
MANSLQVQTLYNEALAMNKRAFDADLFDVAFHFLAGAYYCAIQLDSDDPLLTVSILAKLQLAKIDHDHPECSQSTSSALKRGGESSFARLSFQAERVAGTRKYPREIK